MLFATGLAIGLISGDGLSVAATYAVSFMLFGSFVRTVIVWHQTWAVNSIAHMWGYRNYATDEDSRNNVFVGLFANGEGWHNNHHADPRSARHGHRWWEIDTTWMIIRLLQMLGLAKDVATPRAHLSSRSHSGPITTRGNPGMDE